MSRYSEVQHVVLPKGMSTQTRIERVPLQAAFDVIVPRAKFELLARLQQKKPNLVDRINEVPQPKRAPRRYRYSVKMYNFDVWARVISGRVHLYIARDRAPYGGGIEMPMMPYYPEVEVPSFSWVSLPIFRSTPAPSVIKCSPAARLSRTPQLKSSKSVCVAGVSGCSRVQRGA